MHVTTFVEIENKNNLIWVEVMFVWTDQQQVTSSKGEGWRWPQHKVRECQHALQHMKNMNSPDNRVITTHTK